MTSLKGCFAPRYSYPKLGSSISLAPEIVEASVYDLPGVLAEACGCSEAQETCCRRECLA